MSGATDPAPGGPTDPAARRPGAGRWLLLLILGLGTWLRFEGIAERPIWHDEVYTRIFVAGHHSADWSRALYTGAPLDREALLAFQRLDASQPGGLRLADLVDTVRGLARDEPQHPPVYYVLARLWIGVFGDTLGALRALSGVLSLWALWCMGWFARALALSPPPDPSPEPSPEPSPDLSQHPPTVAVALLALSPFFVLYAQEAREYALWSGWVLASSAALLDAQRLTEAGARRAVVGRRWLAYGLLTAAGLYTCFSHASVIIAQVLHVAWRARGRLTRTSGAAALTLVGSALLFLPWTLQLWRHLDAFRASMSWSHTIEVPTAELLHTLASNLSRPLLDLWPSINGPLPLYAVLPAMALLAVCVVGRVAPAAQIPGRPAARIPVSRAQRTPGPTRAPGRSLVILLLLVPVAVLLGPDLLSGGIRSLSTRYLLPSLLAVLVLVAARLSAVRAPALRRLLTAAVLGLALAGALRNTTVSVPWTRALSGGLPAVAAALNAEPQPPLVVGDRERHHPGNLLALANLVRPGTRFILLDHPHRHTLLEAAEALARAQNPAAVQNLDTPRPRSPLARLLPTDGPLFLYAPIPQLRAALEAAHGGPATPVVRDLFVECWRFDAQAP